MESKSLQEVLQTYRADAMFLIDKETKAPIPLTKIDIKGEIISSLASFEMVQTYVNIEDVPIETVYLFPKEADQVL